MQKKIHIVSFNVPYPADYGGVIDVFCRIKALHALGVEVVLHAFQYGRKESEELRKYCSQVYYYRRKTGIASALSAKPYIVKSRENEELAKRLMEDKAPVLLEGLHCCSMLERLHDRKVFVRAHNVEHDYYTRLAESESNALRRLYFKSEARKLRQYESILRKASAVLAVTQADAEHFESIGCNKVVLMPSSHLDDEVVAKMGRGDYVLYHGDLSVSENIQAVDYLVEKIMPYAPYRFVVAGRNPSEEMRKKLSKLQNVSVVANPDDATMRRLVANAQVLFLVTDFATGLKLKLLNSLYAGRHCLVNGNMVAGTRLGELCTVADTAERQLDSLDSLMDKPFTESDLKYRSNMMGALYSNEANAAVLARML